ncbi:PREDICTED: NAD-dependent malic enzyme 2, mitochondrial-like [Camelina sativa]|uniref:NAD-dependent malic enzyme 2, mitochondrial-like n=1 Tax=Camelina sativa TaxID=90675 RepID=A0ABM0ZLD5_CAMSA|nr:PREDICTED: NAD-dependent malic enzyme 2, mitochondrial-like [Camelina sativa]
MLDVGTYYETLLQNDLYLGEEHLEILDEFGESVVQGNAGASGRLLGTVIAQGRLLSEFVNQKIVVVGAGSVWLGVSKMALHAVARMALAGIREIDATETVLI